MTVHMHSMTAAVAAMAARSTTEEPSSPLQRFGFAIILFFPFLALIVVCLRTYSRLSTKQFGIDDALIIFSMALSLAETGASYMYIKTNYVGIHGADIPVTYDARTALVWNYIVQLLYNPILAIVKTSVLLFLLKLGSQKKSMRQIVHILNAFNICLMIAIFLVVVFQCTPISFNWDTTIAGGHCISQGDFYVTTAAMTIFTDILSLALPFWVFINLKMRLRVKIALLFVFMLGGIVTAVGVVRLVFLYRVFIAKAPAGSDPTYSLSFCLSAIETNLAIICASAPSMRGLVRYWFPRFFSSHSPNDHYQYPSGYADRNGRTGGSSARHGIRSLHSGAAAYGLGSTSTNITSRWKDDEDYGHHHHRSRQTGGGSGNDSPHEPGDTFVLSDMKNAAHTQHSHNSSEEEIITRTGNGIVRTTNVSVEYENERGLERQPSQSHSITGPPTSLSV